MHHIVTIHRSDSVLEKPPDYETVTGASPPSYEDAIKLSPAQLLDRSVSTSKGFKELFIKMCCSQRAVKLKCSYSVAPALYTHDSTYILTISVLLFP